MPMNPADPRIPADARAPEETLYRGKWLSLYRRGRWEYAARNNPGGAVIILAVTPEDKVLFVEQYRVSILKNTIEMPAGLVGDLAGQADESALLAARRELEEETGYRAGRMIDAGRFASSPGMVSETFTLMVAKDLVKTGEGGGVAGEDIIVHRVPLPDVAGFIAGRRTAGVAMDAKLLLLLGAGLIAA